MIVAKDNIATVYKAVRQYDYSRIKKLPLVHRNEWLSLTYYTNNSDYTVEYKIGKAAYPKDPNSYLYAFDSLDNVKGFLIDQGWQRQSDVGVFKCKAQIVDAKPMIAVSGLYRDFWRHYVLPDRPLSPAYFCRTAPFGTVYCKWIKMIKQVKI